MQNSISSKAADTLPRYEQVVALGRKLVDELGKEPNPDTLSRWMAHYVADLIDGAENVTPAESDALRQEMLRQRSWSCGVTELICRVGGGRSKIWNPWCERSKAWTRTNDTPRFFRSVRREVAKERTKRVADPVSAWNSWTGWIRHRENHHRPCAR